MLLNQLRNCCLNSGYDCFFEHRHTEALFSGASLVMDPQHLPKCFIVLREAPLMAQELVTSSYDVDESAKKTKDVL